MVHGEKRQIVGDRCEDERCAEPDGGGDNECVDGRARVEARVGEEPGRDLRSAAVDGKDIDAVVQDTIDAGGTSLAAVGLGERGGRDADRGASLGRGVEHCLGSAGVIRVPWGKR